MYIIKNALRNIRRSKGRSILLGGIAFTIGLCACLALSIRQAAQQERESGLEGMSITATISVDRQSMMEDMRKEDSEGTLQKEDMKERMSGMESLSLEEMKKFAKADAVKDFQYTISTSLNGKSIDPIETSDTMTAREGDRGVGKGMATGMGDFTLTGYSSYKGMDDFVNGTKTITSGEMFTEGSSELECVISEEVATLNSLKVNDTFTLENPSNSEETFTLKVTGIYTSTDSDPSMGMTMNDPANQIYLSYEAVNRMAESSASDEDSALRTRVNGTYFFENVEMYEAFEEQARDLGLSDTYTIQSSDINAYEQQLQPLENLSTYATYFLVVILGIGGVILIILNIYHIRERKYEIGVLAAIGMKKAKIAEQFIIEIFTITLLAVLLGTGLGAVSSVPVTNALLSTQTTTNISQESFGQPQDRGGMNGMPDEPMKKGTTSQVIEEVSSATDMSVVVQLIGIGIVLTVISGGISVMSILRYEPLKILSNRE